jgi:hypothetical protein
MMSKMHVWPKWTFAQQVQEGGAGVSVEILTMNAQFLTTLTLVHVMQ